MGVAEVVVVGAGPSGAVTALTLARAGHDVTVVDRARFPRDKACGEGLMPPGVRVLERLGLRDAVMETGARPLHSVTYTRRGGGPAARAPFPAPPDGADRHGLGVRRVRFDAVLVDALRAEPRVVLHEGVRVLDLVRAGDAVCGVRTASGDTVAARLVVGADGLHSPLRAAAGWTRPHSQRGRYGLAGHWRLDARAYEGITVMFAGGHEWYRAPVAPEELLVSVLGGRRRVGEVAHRYAEEARAACPELRDAELIGPPLAAGQFRQWPRRIAGGGLFLVGDAAGYDDPTTGEGLAAGMELGERLARHLAAVLDGTRSVDAAGIAYARDHAGLWRDRRRLTRLALLMAASPSLSRRAVAGASGRPDALVRLLGVNCGYWGFSRLRPRDWLTLAGI